MGLNAGAIVGLRLGGMLVPRCGSRPALRLALPGFATCLVGPAMAPNLLSLVTLLFLFAPPTAWADVSMNAQGVALEQRYDRPVLSSMHAMHSLGDILGAVIGALAARNRARSNGPLHRGRPRRRGRECGGLISHVPADAGTGPSSSPGPLDLSGWVRGRSGPIALLGALAFRVTLAEGATLDWAAVYVDAALGGSSALGGD
jgi:hypothetical protein